MRQFYQHYFTATAKFVLVALVKRPTTINHA